MPYNAKVYQVMIASPSDVSESGVIQEVILEWNVIHSRDKGIVLLPVTWKTHAAPSMAGPPQSVVNTQVLANADLLIAVFSARLGSPTATFQSGTIEEIHRHREANKPAMIYFSKAAIPLDSVDPEQLAALKAFESEIKKEALVDDYSSDTDLRTKLSRQLAQTVMEHCKGPDTDGTSGGLSNTTAIQAIENVSRLLQVQADIGTRPSNDAIFEATKEVTRLLQSQAAQRAGTNHGGTDSLSPEAKRLLLAVAADPKSGIMHVRYSGGLDVHAGRVNFAESGNKRSEALWEAALEELEEKRLVRPLSTKREIFEMTAAGFSAADKLSDTPPQ